MKVQMIWELRKWKNSTPAVTLACVLFCTLVLAFPAGIILPDLTDHIPYTSYKVMAEVIQNSGEEITSDRVQRTFDSMLLDRVFPRRRIASTLQQELSVYKETADELEEVERVYAHWDDVISNAAERLQAGESDAYLRRYGSLLQMRASRLKSMFRRENVRFSGGYGLWKVWNYGAGHVLLAAIMILFLSCIVSNEHEKGTLEVIYHSHCHGNRMILAKYAVGLLGMAGILTAVYVSRLATAAMTYGLPDLNLPIQCVPYFGNSLSPIRIRTAILFYILLQFIAYQLLYTICFCIHLMARNGMLSILLDTGLLLAEAAASRISSHGFFAVFRKWNLYTFVHAETFLSRYDPMPVGGIPVDGVAVMLLFLGIAGLLVTLSVRAGFRTRKNTNPFRSSYALLEGLVRWCFGGRTLAGYEVRKSWFYDRGWILIIVLAAGILFLGRPQKDLLYTDDEIWYRHYVLSVEGVYSTEKLHTLQEEQERLLAMKTMSGSETSEEQAAYYAQQLKRLPAVEKLLAYADYLRTQPGSSFVYERSYRTLWAVGGFGKAVYGLRILQLLLMIVGTILIWNADLRTNMTPIIKSSAVGEEPVIRIRTWEIVLAAAILTAVTHIVWYFCLRDGWQFDFSAAANSLPGLAVLPDFVTMGVVTAAQALLHFGIMCVLGLGGGSVLRRTKNVSVAVVSMLLAGVLLIFI